MVSSKSKVLETKNIGLFGGTFDPPHQAHKQLVLAALTAVKLDELIIIPSGNPYMKPAPQATAQQRLADTTSFFADVIKAHPFVRVSDIEIRRSGKTYLSDTVQELARNYSEKSIVYVLYFICGSDSLVDLPQWHDFAYLVTNLRFLVGLRDNVPLDQSSIKALARVKYQILDGDFASISSTQIRKGA